MKERFRERRIQREVLRHHPDPGEQDKFSQGGAHPEVPGERRERVSTQKIDELLAGVFNNESKMIVLGGMILNPHWYSDQQLHDMTMRMQRGERGWGIGNHIPFGYCQDSFDDIGLVAKNEIDGARDSLKYHVTQDGISALPAIGHLLSFVEESGISLHRTFSTTSTPSSAASIDSEEEHNDDRDIRKRAPKTRYRIFKQLLAHEGPIQKVDLQENLNVNGSSLGHHLRNLSIEGMLDYQSYYDGEPLAVTYRINADAFQKINYDDLPRDARSTITTITRRVAFIAAHMEGTVTPAKVHEKLLALYPQYAERTEGHVRSSVNRALTHLAKHEYLQRGEISADRPSLISLTDEQRERMQQLVTIIDTFQSGDPEFLAQGEQKAREILNDPQRVARLMRHAQENSRIALALGPAELKQMIIEIIKDSDTPLSGARIVPLMDHRIGQPYATALLKQLYDGGEIALVSEGRSKWYGKLQETGGVDALPEDRDGLRSSLQQVTAEFQPYENGLGLLFAALDTHDPASADAREVLNQIEYVRMDPEYRRLKGRIDTIQDRLESFADEIEDEAVADETQVRKRTPRQSSVVIRQRIDAFRDLGITNQSEIARWMGFSPDSLKYHFQSMDDTLNRAISPERMAKIDISRALRDQDQLTPAQIAERMGTTESTARAYLELADDAERLANQREVTSPYQDRLVRVREMEEEWGDMMQVTPMVHQMAAELGLSVASIHNYRRELFATRARAARVREGQIEQVRAMTEELQQLPNQERVLVIAERLGLNRSTVYRFQDKAFGVAEQRKVGIAERRARVAQRSEELRAMGIPIKEAAKVIAEEEGVSPGTIMLDRRALLQSQREATQAENLSSSVEETIVYEADHSLPDLSSEQSLNTFNETIDWSGEDDPDIGQHRTL